MHTFNALYHFSITVNIRPIKKTYIELFFRTEKRPCDYKKQGSFRHSFCNQRCHPLGRRYLLDTCKFLYRQN